MKVLHIISGDLWAGAEVQAFTLLTTLHRQSDVQVAAALMNEGELAQRLRECNIPVTVLPENALNAIDIVAGLHKLMRSWQPDVIHTHRIKENILGSIASRLSIDAPSVRTVHGAAEHTSKGFRQIHKQGLSYLNNWTGRHLQQRVIAVSQELAEKLTDEFSSEQIVVIENGVDIDAVRAQDHPVEFRTASPNATHIGIVGRLVPVKRVDLFLETAALLRQQYPERDWHFHIFGDGPLHTILTAQATQLQIADIVAVHGHRGDIIACIAALDALVMCSDHEGLPMTLLEAMAIGTPIAGHAVGGITQLLHNGDLGWPVIDQQAASYATAITDILDNPSARGLRTIAAKDNVLTHYSAQLCAQRHTRLYQELMHS